VRILLDECVPIRFAQFIPGHEVITAQQFFGTTNLDDGSVLDRIPGGHFDAFITVYKNLRFQQNLRGRVFRIVLLRAPSNALEYLVPLVPSLVVALAESVPGDFRVVGVQQRSDTGRTVGSESGALAGWKGQFASAPDSHFI
jgi:hypothetical protein